MYKIYSLKKEKRKTLDSLLADDIVGRQTITYKNAENYVVWTISFHYPAQPVSPVGEYGNYRER